MRIASVLFQTVVHQELSDQISLCAVTLKSLCLHEFLNNSIDKASTYILSKQISTQQHRWGSRGQKKIFTTTDNQNCKNSHKKMISESKNNILMRFFAALVVLSRIQCVIHISINLEWFVIMKLSHKVKKTPKTSNKL